MKPCFLGRFCRAGFEQAEVEATQKGRTWFFQKFHATKATKQVVEPEPGRRIQSQMSNLVIGVVPRPARITHAASDRVGSCGAKLLNGLLKHQWQAAYSFPSGWPPMHHNTTPGALASVSFSRERVRQRAVGRLLRNSSRRLVFGWIVHAWK